MKKVLWGSLGIIFFLCLFGAFQAYAEDVNATTSTSLKEELQADKAKIQSERQEMKQNAQTGKTEEKDLRQQIQAAQAAGDTQKVSELRSQLKTTHKENVQERKQDKKDLRTAKKELRQDRKAARQSRR